MRQYLQYIYFHDLKQGINTRVKFKGKKAYKVV